LEGALVLTSRANPQKTDTTIASATLASDQMPHMALADEKNEHVDSSIDANRPSAQVSHFH
jgi:hypothetical protein